MAQVHPPPARALRVLIADDDATNRLVALRLLARLGHYAEAVPDGAEAVKALSHNPYDLVLMDVAMPEMGGVCATRTIRAGTSPMNAVPIIGLTGAGRSDDEQTCLDAGMNAYLTKPVTTARLAAGIEAALNRTGLPAEEPAMEAPLLDRMFMVELIDGIGRDGAIEAMRVFIEEGSRRGSRIRHAQADGADAALRREAHALGGAARAVGFVQLGETAYRLQHRIERGQAPADATAILLSLLDRCIEEGQAWIGQQGTDPDT